MRIVITLLLTFFTCVFVSAQVTNRDNYDLKNPGKDLRKKCAGLIFTSNATPGDARFSTFIKGDSVLLTHSDEYWFWKLFPSKNDGFAIDLVFKDQYQCDNIERNSPSWSHKGYLLPPLYRDNIKSNLIPVSLGYVAVYAGRIPAGWNKEDVEPNYLLLENKALCSYSTIINVDFHGWDLLQTGLYYDTLNVDEMDDRFHDITKTMHFTIPFEKDKWEYREQDIRPLYDSLRLTDYAIKDIRIHAYTSVEGTTERNQKLQRLRAESIVKALQSFQPEKLQSSIATSENWVEFMEDVVKTSSSGLASLSKEEIKEKLKTPDILARLEPVLKRHRKGIVELDLEKRVPYLKSTGDELKKYFGQHVASGKITEALHLQQIIFYKIDRHELPPTFLNELDVPETIASSALLINDASFRYEYFIGTLAETIATFERLNTLIPNNPKIKYNLCALRLRQWLDSKSVGARANLRKEIESLGGLGIPDLLVKRLLINYHIILTDFHLRQKNYSEKDKAVKFIFDTYKRAKLNDQDLLNLAKYFSHNSRFDWAKLILQPRTRSLDVSEDILFYYLTLTISDERNTRSASYRTVMLNAINGNQQRFCDLFNSREKGGVTFQLLADKYLKKTYCENCSR